MRVHIVCGYPGNSEAWKGGWSDAHYRARNIVKAVKREKFKGFSNWKDKSVPPKIYRVDDTAAGQRAALRLAAIWLARRLLDAGISEADIVPVPSSQHTVLGQEFTGSRIADELQTVHAGMRSRPILRFCQAQPKTHDSGTRNPNAIQPHLRSGPVASLRQVILLDDVMTSGGHLQAARRFLANKDVEVAAAVVIARTLWDRPSDMFAIPAEDLPD